MEEKDRLLEEYALALCSQEELDQLPEEAVKSCKRSPYAFLHKGKLLLMEEKDRLLEEYALALCSQEELDQLPEEAVKSCKRSPYGAEALVLRQFVPEGIHTRPVTIEELFIFMVKEAN